MKLPHNNVSGSFRKEIGKLRAFSCDPDDSCNILQLQTETIFFSSLNKFIQINKQEHDPWLERLGSLNPGVYCINRSLWF